MDRNPEFRTAWLSDLHLGSRSCQATLLLDFLRHLHCEQLYLVGDVIDIASMRRRVHWPSAHAEVLRLLLEKSQQGTRVIYIPGNHDEELRAFIGARFGSFEVVEKTIHTTRSGKRLLILHGDEFDRVIQHNRLVALAGAAGYGLLLAANRLVHGVRTILGRPYWSFAQHVKQRLGGAQRHIEHFRRAGLAAARAAGADGIVCGHIHLAEIREQEGLLYCNDGDWVESCTALVEDLHGELSLQTWQQERSPVSALAAATPDAA